jgi:hypothetical protein
MRRTEAAEMYLFRAGTTNMSHHKHYEEVDKAGELCQFDRAADMTALY